MLHQSSQIVFDQKRATKTPFTKLKKGGLRILERELKSVGAKPLSEDQKQTIQRGMQRLHQGQITVGIARLKAVMKGAEADGAWDSRGRIITNYSARHHYITEGIQRGVDIYDLAINCGTSLTYIEQTYSHVTTLMRSKEITKNLGKHRLYDPLNEKSNNEPI